MKRGVERGRSTDRIPVAPPAASGSGGRARGAGRSKKWGRSTARILGASLAASVGVLLAACATRLGGDGAVTAEGRPCATDRDCPQPSNPCQVWTCWQEVCTPVAAARDTVLPAAAQSAGDCKLLVCDGQGKATALEDEADVPPEDDNPCADEVCQDGAPAYPPVAVGAPCGKAGICNGHGKCGGCYPMEQRCRGNTPETCSEEGTWEDHGPCPAITPVCGQRACLGVLEVAAGGGFSCARLADKKVRCFGDPAEGRLGGAGARRVSGLSGVIQVAAGEAHTCALLSDRTVRCWGDNGEGQLGDATEGQRGNPAPVPKLADVTQIALGRDFSCARRADGTAVCWGANAYGQLGTLPSPARTAAVLGLRTMMAPAAQDRPVEVVGLASAAQLALGGQHGCALLVDGAVWCWGSDARGQLGRSPAPPPGKPGKPARPVKPLLPVRGLKGVVEVAAGGEHACARLEDATVVCWGRNQHGQLGDGTTRNSPSPVKVKGLAGAAGLSLGDAHGCALLVDGKVKCWGAGAQHATGDASDADHPEPFEVPGVASAVSLASGADHVCAGLFDRTFLCWGANASGQLGSGSTGQKPEPIVW